MKNTIAATDLNMVPLKFNVSGVQWLVIGGGLEAQVQVQRIMHHAQNISVLVVAESVSQEIMLLKRKHEKLRIEERSYEISDLDHPMVIIATGNEIIDQKVAAEAKQFNILISVPSQPGMSDFLVSRHVKPTVPPSGNWFQRNTEQPWKNLVSKLVLAFVLMVIGHIIISYLPLPGVKEIWTDAKPYFDQQFLFFVAAGFLAQMVDGVLSMGYGVTSATCLMSFGVNPVSVSAAIHTSEIFTTGISGYSHYRFGNVNKKLFKHLVIPGVIGAVLGALILVYLGEHFSKYLMPVIALYAGFLGMKILFKAFQADVKNKKVKRLGWLAGAGGFFDSFGGGGWGPIVTSSLISKGRSPKYTIGSVSLTEFFVTLSSAFTFFITVGVSHWNVILGLIVGGAAAAPIAARLAGKLPRKTMMILVGVMVMIWCTRMFIKSI